MFWNQYPYINLNDLNLDFLLKAIGEMQNEVKNFVTLNAVKYADPIQWDITSQYEKNTIVIDPLTGTAYISVQPVPSGVALNRTEYWTPVFDLSRFITQGNENLTEHVEDAGVVYSTFALNVGDWVIWNGILYKALVNMPIGTAYSVDGNIKRVTVEEYIKDILTAIANEVQARIDGDDALNIKIGDLNDLTTTDKTNIVTAINEVNDDIENVVKSQLFTLNVLQYGVKNDGVTDCAPIVQSLLNTYAPCALYFPCGKYLFESGIEMPEKCQLIGDNNNESTVPMKGIDGVGGTVFLINFENESLITFRSGNVFKGILFYYVNILDNVTPTAKPFTFTWKTGLSDPIYGVKFQTLYFANSWGCIECDTGHGDLIFNDIVGSPARYGFHLDWSGGTDIFTDIRMSYFYFTTVSTAYAQFMQANCEGIWFGYSDAFHCKALYFGNLNAGITFNESNLVTNGLAYGSIYGLSIDGCNYGIYSNGTHPIGVVVTDMMANCVSYGIMCAGTKKSYFKVANSNYWWNARIAIQKASEMLFNGCSFNVDNNETAINITDNGAKIIVSGCEFGTGVTPIKSTPSSGVNTIIASNNLSDIYPQANLPIVGKLYNNNNWSSGSKDIGNASSVTLTGENVLLFNQANAFTLTESAPYIYPSESELTIFNYGGASGSITVNGVTKTIASNSACKLMKFASNWYIVD